MITALSAAAACVTFIILSIFIITYLHSSMKKINQIHSEATELIRNLNNLTEDLQGKSKSCNFIFKLLNVFNKDHPCKISETELRIQQLSENLAEIIDALGAGAELASKIKGEIKNYVKSK